MIPILRAGRRGHYPPPGGISGRGMPAGHSGHAFERVVRDQLAFLTRHVPVVSASGEDSDV